MSGSLAKLALGVVSLSVAVATAHAGAWEEFEARCLTPMENVEAPVTQDLSKHNMAEQDGKSATTFRMDLPNADTLFFVVTEAGAAKTMCGMTNVEIGQTPDAAVQELVGSGQYELVGGVEGQAYVLHSSEWREPVLELELRSDGANVTWIARDTDLEG